LAGRIAYLELTGLTLIETGTGSQDTLWLRGGFPASLTASSGPASMRWRNNFIRTYLERDIPQFGPRIAAENLQRFWTMLAHHQGGLLNVAHLARNLGVDVKTAQSYIDLMCDLLLVRRLRPWHANIGKRLVKTPKVYVRDSGLVHALLNIDTTDALLSHMVVGASWEGYCIENILACTPAGVQAYFYRTSGGAEIDLLLLWPGNELWAIEIKRGHAAKVGRGFYSACEDLKPTKKIVVSSGQDNYPIGADIRVMSLQDICQLINSNS
jgi:predicted AAA+ superfamily ATPase